MRLAVTQFCAGRQFPLIVDNAPVVPQMFADLVNIVQDMGVVTDGYAPFCKHLWLPNAIGLTANVVPITDENRPLLRTGYLARREGELPVLSRWFPATEVTRPVAKWLDLILYSKEQLALEGEAIEGDYGIVCINPEMEQEETPILPATQLRNALGISEGGSGVAIDRAKYLKAVEFWEQHAIVSDDRP